MLGRAVNSESPERKPVSSVSVNTSVRLRATRNLGVCVCLCKCNELQNLTMFPARTSYSSITVGTKFTFTESFILISTYLQSLRWLLKFHNIPECF